MEQKNKNSETDEKSHQSISTTEPPEAKQSPSSPDEDGGKVSDKDGSKGTSHRNPLEAIQHFLSSKLHISLFESDDEEDVAETVLKSVDLIGLVEHWKAKGFKKIITAVGAGISTSAGIPDFRSPSIGLYNNLQKYNLPYPTAIFELDYFIKNPEPFYKLAKELYPGAFKPTPCHYFIRLLHEKGMLLRHYTQNIDCLERVAGIPEEKLVEAHGTFFTNHCIGCEKAYTMEWVKEQIFADNVPTCTECNHVVKPDIVFFGENLPERFYHLSQTDFKECDLLIIIGSSLEVQPFASLVSMPPKKCVRFLINRDRVGHTTGIRSWFSHDALRYDHPDNKRDVAWFGECDEGVRHLAQELGFLEELEDLLKKEHERIDELKKRADDLLEKNEEKPTTLCKSTENLAQVQGETIQKINLEEEKELTKKIQEVQKHGENSENDK